MFCVNHSQAVAVAVPWWKTTHWLDVEYGHCSQCVPALAGTSVSLVQIGSEEFWRCFDDMQRNHWAREAD